MSIRLQASISATTIQTIVKSGLGKQVIVLRNTRITSFKPDDVILAQGKSGFVTDVG